jgi:formylglycine-generating enzyme required for sulfatase activity
MDQCLRYSQQAAGFIQDLANDTQLEMVSIPGGTFVMGSPPEEPEELEHQEDESPQHSVTVQPFFMGKYQVTQAQWRFVAHLPQVNKELNPDPSKIVLLSKFLGKMQLSFAIAFQIY